DNSASLEFESSIPWNQMPAQKQKQASLGTTRRARLEKLKGRASPGQQKGVRGQRGSMAQGGASRSPDSQGGTSPDPRAASQQATEDSLVKRSRQWLSEQERQGWPGKSNAGAGSEVIPGGASGSSAVRAHRQIVQTPRLAPVMQTRSSTARSPTPGESQDSGKLEGNSWFPTTARGGISGPHSFATFQGKR
ncbi:unnamed protein product, partial [Polarella glacialis]